MGLKEVGHELVKLCNESRSLQVMEKMYAPGIAGQFEIARKSGERLTVEEIGVCTVGGDEITREQFVAGAP